MRVSVHPAKTGKKRRRNEHKSDYRTLGISAGHCDIGTLPVGFGGWFSRPLAAALNERAWPWSSESGRTVGARLERFWAIGFSARILNMIAAAATRLRTWDTTLSQ